MHGIGTEGGQVSRVGEELGEEKITGEETFSCSESKTKERERERHTSTKKLKHAHTHAKKPGHPFKTIHMLARTKREREGDLQRLAAQGHGQAREDFRVISSEQDHGPDRDLVPPVAHVAGTGEGEPVARWPPSAATPKRVGGWQV